MNAYSSPPLPIEARVVGQTLHYVAQSDAPAWSLGHEMKGFLFTYRFGEKGRRMTVRLLDGKRRFVWAVGYDGVGKAWVRARPDLARCGPGGPIPTSDDRDFLLPVARSAADAAGPTPRPVPG